MRQVAGVVGLKKLDRHACRQNSQQDAVLLGGCEGITCDLSHRNNRFQEIGLDTAGLL
jgi:hypothetical protein